MFSVGNGRVEIDAADGWPAYRQALELVGQGDWSRSLTLQPPVAPEHVHCVCLLMSRILLSPATGFMVDI